MTPLEQLLVLDEQTVPDTLNRAGLLLAVQRSAWLSFGIGVSGDEPAPDDASVDAAARDFVQHWSAWRGYRGATILVSPPRAAPVRFRIDGALPPPADFPASTFAVITAWNPGGVERIGRRANARANERLAAHLDARMVERWPAMNAPGTRYAEESFAVLGLDLEEAWRLAEAFGQRAIYYIERGTPFLVARRRARVVTWRGELSAG